MNATGVVFRRRFLVRGAVAMAAALAIAGPLAAGSSASPNPSMTANTFHNNTGKNVNDLHIQYQTAITQVQQNPMTFGQTDGLGTNAIDLSGGVVAIGGQVQVIASGVANHTRINKWFWTKNGRRVGPVHSGCEPPDCTTP